MINFFDILNSIYTKKPIGIEPDIPLTITLTKWLSWDKDNLLSLKKILPYFYYLTPQQYYDLLFYNIPQKSKAPFIKKIEKVEIKEDKVLQKIKKILDWSNRELEFNKSILLKQINIDRKTFEKELGIK